MKKILVLGAGGQIGSELTMRLREVYGNGNVIASDLNPSRLTQEIKDSGVCLPCDATDAKQIAQIVADYKIDERPSCLAGGCGQSGGAQNQIGRAHV